MRGPSFTGKPLLSSPDSPSPPPSTTFSRTVRQRGLWFPPFCIALILFAAVLGFPDRVQQLHCALGVRRGCSASVVAAARAGLYNRAAITRSCRPARAGGRVVFVTGSAGFIGFWAALRLRERGDGVVGIDNFNDYYPVSLKHARAAELAAAGVHTVHGDINNQAVLQQIFDVRLSPLRCRAATGPRPPGSGGLGAVFGRAREESCARVQICKPTHVLHLAAQAGVRYAKIKPLNYLDANVHGTTVLLEAVKAQPQPPLFVYASSSSVYGGNEHVPFTETDTVDKPLSLYAASKRACELLAGVYHGVSGVSVTGLRFFTVYGPWGRPDMAALAFAHQITRGHPVKIYQGPGQTELARDFTYIDDIIAVRPAPSHALALHVCTAPAAFAALRQTAALRGVRSNGKCLTSALSGCSVGASCERAGMCRVC